MSRHEPQHLPQRLQERKGNVLLGTSARSRTQHSRPNEQLCGYVMPAKIRKVLTYQGWQTGASAVLAGHMDSVRLFAGQGANAETGAITLRSSDWGHQGSPLESSAHSCASLLTCTVARSCLGHGILGALCVSAVQSCKHHPSKITAACLGEAGNISSLRGWAEHHALSRLVAGDSGPGNRSRAALLSSRTPCSAASNVQPSAGQ